MKPSFSSYKVLAILILMFQISSSSAAYYDNSGLDPDFYINSCPEFYQIVWGIVNDAIAKEARMGASLLRLHFHDCFVNGCDGSVLLDDTPTFTGEKRAAGNVNSIRGFEVVDSIKARVEAKCPGMVSCADILAYAAMVSVAGLGGPLWWVDLGRRDSLTASQADANRSLPAPTSDLKGLVSSFAKVGLTKRDVATLSGAHTIGLAKCKNFRGRLYNENSMINSGYAQALKSKCPRKSGDDNFAPLDYTTDVYFDSNYYTNVLNKRALLHSDNQLSLDPETRSMVAQYSNDTSVFWGDFVDAMSRMGRISPLLATGQGEIGEIRKNCRMVNSD